MVVPRRPLVLSRVWAWVSQGEGGGGEGAAAVGEAGAGEPEGVGGLEEAGGVIQ